MTGLPGRLARWWTGRHSRSDSAGTPERDMRPAVGRAGGPASWRRAVDGAGVALHGPDFSDARWSSIFRLGTHYASAPAPAPDAIAAANLRGRRGPAPDPDQVQGPFLQPAVWTWEVPVYFWLGGMAAGATFIAAGADLAGDRSAARIARGVAFGAMLPCPVLLISDLGRPERFLHMLRIVKPRSPMSMGTYCLSAFGGVSFLSVAADALGHRRAARRLGAANVPLAAYLGAYTGVLLAATAIPLWSRSRAFLGPIFVATATLAGASATRLTLAAAGRSPANPTRVALTRIEDGALTAELVLSQLNRRRLGSLAGLMDDGLGAPWFARAERLGRAGLAARVLSRRWPGLDHLASVCFLGAALSYRFAWVRAGRSSARDDVSVAMNARRDVSAATASEPDSAPGGLVVTQHG